MSVAARDGRAMPRGDIAIIGMAGTYAGAPDVATFWDNVLGRVDAVDDAPPGWDPEPDPAAGPIAEYPLYCRRGGFLANLAKFNPLEFAVMPRTAAGGEPDQFHALRTAQEALRDAGYLDRPFNRQKTEVILGHGTFLNRGSVTALQHTQMLDQTLRVLKELHPEYGAADLRAIRDGIRAGLPPFNIDTAPALVPNMVCGRLANRLDLMGPNYAIDAACASSLIAVEQAVRDLLIGKADMVLTGGIHCSTPSIIVLGFCMVGAISRRQEIRPFDRLADGTILGEGVGILVLKRLEDAVRDDDRIYAVIKGIGTSSDGRAMGLLTPRLEGEELALRRAYENAHIDTATIGLIEAHGTGTPVGDQTEIEALRRVFGPRVNGHPTIAIGSVKSMISHTMEAAGAAALIKTALALQNKVLPPTLHCDEPDPNLHFETTPLYPNTEARPWIHSGPLPRRAGVSAFGFGGINAHVILEEFHGGS
jgi:acyl transferase domain-containing protein